MRPTSSMRVIGVSALALAASALTSAQAQSSSFASNQRGGSLDGTLSAQAPSQSGAAIQAAEPVAQPRPVVGSFTLSAGAGRVIRLNTAAANVFTADPKVAEVRPRQCEQPIRIWCGTWHYDCCCTHRHRGCSRAIPGDRGTFRLRCIASAQCHPSRGAAPIRHYNTDRNRSVAVRRCCYGRRRRT